MYKRNGKYDPGSHSFNLTKNEKEPESKIKHFDIRDQAWFFSGSFLINCSTYI